MLKLRHIIVSINKQRSFSSIALILLVFVSLFCLISSVYGKSETVTVAPVGSMKRTVNLNQGDSVSGTLTPTASGFMTNMGSLTVIAPDNSLLVNSAITSNKQVPFSFSAHVSGTYTIEFWNMNALQSARATLDYTVQSNVQSSEFLNDNLNPIIICIGIVVIIICVGTAIILNFNSKKTKVSPNVTPISSSQPVKAEVFDEPKQISVNKSVIKCGECGTSNDIDAIFCKNCGNRFR